MSRIEVNDAMHLWEGPLGGYDEDGREVSVVWSDPKTREYAALVKDDSGWYRYKWPAMNGIRYGDRWHGAIMEDDVVRTVIVHRDAQAVQEIRCGRLFIDGTLRTMAEIKENLINQCAEVGLQFLAERYEKELPDRLKKLCGLRQEIISAGWPESR